MVIDGIVRRPGVVLAGCAWVAFAALAAGPVQQAALLPGSLRPKIEFASTGFGVLSSLCLVVAATLLAVEQRTVAVDRPTVAAVAGTVAASAVLAVLMAVAGIVVLPLWSTSTPASAWVEGVQPYLTAGALAALAAVLALRPARGQ